MKKTLLTLGLSTAVIFGIQAQQTPVETEQEEQDPQEEVIEARGEAEEETYESEKQVEGTSAKTSFSTNDMAQVDKADLPEEVMESFESSDFKEGTIERAYEIDGAAVPQILESRANLSIYAGEQLPETLYIMHVNLDDGQGILYFGDDGESIASEKINLDESFSLFGNTEEDKDDAAYETKETVENTTDEIEEAGEEMEETAEQAEDATYETKETVRSAANTKENETRAKADERNEKMEKEFESKETTSAANTKKSEMSAKADERTKKSKKMEKEFESKETTSAVNTKKNEMSAKADERTKKMEEKFESKEMALVTVSDLPKNVTESFENSDWSDGTIHKAYEFDGAVVSDILDERAELTMYIGEQIPETLYLLQVEHKDGLSFMYVGDDGEIYASEDM